jgi:hypothetical protein
MNITTLHQEAPPDWAETHFGEVDLGDVRRNQRVVTIATAMATNPAQSLPQMFLHPYDVKAAYHLFDHPEATPEQLQAGHQEVVQARLQQAGRYLLLEDTSEMSWAGHAPIPGLGPIGSGAAGLQGFHLHTMLAVRWQWEGRATTRWPGRPSVELLGLPVQHYHVRQTRAAGQPVNHAKSSRQETRESQWWQAAGAALGPAPAAAGIEWTRVCDRGADIYEQLVSCTALHHRFIIRAAQDRCLTDAEGRQSTGALWATAQAQAALGSFALELRARPGQAARTAQLQVSAVPVWLRAPQRPGQSPGNLPPVRVTVVRVWEAAPPPGVAALEWVLLTDWPVADYAQALEVALAYATRWLLEEFHKALKTGNRAEDLQLETAARLFAAIALKSIVALRLLDLRERVRLAPDAPAEQAGLNELELQVLRQVVRRPLPTVRDVALALGRLGGHMNRKADGLPGWQTLLRGMTKLTDMVEGASIALKLKRFG